MNDKYEINKESLLGLSRKIYEEGCGGYMDLRDSACEKLVEEFLHDKKTKKEDGTPLSEGLPPSGVSWAQSLAGSWNGGIGVPTTVGSDYVVGIDPALETAGLGTITFTSSPSIPQVENFVPPENNLGGIEITLRNQDEDMLRRETMNYFGNESERM